MDLLKLLSKVNYKGQVLSNLMHNISIIKENIVKFDVYFAYRVGDGERPDTIAYDYYGNSDYAWLVMISNSIIDPYFQWPLDINQFHDYLRAKYGVVWELKSQVLYYKFTGIGENDPDIGYITHNITQTTFDNMDPIETSGWTAVYVYDYEYDLNESRRNIRLLSNQYLKMVDREISTLLR